VVCLIYKQIAQTAGGGFGALSRQEQDRPAEGYIELAFVMDTF
jgi:hypothetical protein